MRIVSPDYTINASYENSLFCIVEDEENSEYTVSIRNSNLTSYLPLATYPTKEAAIEEMKNIINFAEDVYNDDDSVYVIKSQT